MLKATLAAMAMVTFCALAVPATHFVTPAMAWCEVGTEGCGETSEDQGGGPGGINDDGSDDTGNGHGGPGGNGGDIDDTGDTGGVGGSGSVGDPTSIAAINKIQRIEATCNGALQKLVKIPESLVESYTNSGGVTVVGLCNSGLGHKASIDGSQALPLQAAIAANPALAGPLQQRGYQVEDVVGVVLFSTDVATLYVHKSTL